MREFKEAKLPDDDMDLQKAEKILREFSAKDGELVQGLDFKSKAKGDKSF